MAGTIPFSLTQQFDIYGQPLAGGKFYGIQAATVSTPQNFFQDFALTLPWPNPITLDAAGRIPQLYCADGSIKIRLTDAAGVTQVVADNITVIGPSSGGGGGGTVDPTTIYQTGDLKSRYGTGAHTGWVRANNMTIGSSTSGATERANLDCQALFIYLWGVDSALVVSGGRGASGLADWNANKQLSLPDYRGYALSALDDMGNTASGRINFLGAAATTLGGVGGSQSATLAAGNIPAHTHSGSTGFMDRANPHSHGVNGGIYAGTVQNAGIQGGGTFLGSAGSLAIGINNTDINHAHAFTTDGGAGLAGSAFSVISPRKLCSIYLKL